jgi:ribosomal protein S18 acetylase RimI-like enzyme
VSENIFVAKTKSDLEKCYPVLKELRPHLSFEDYLKIYDQAHLSNGYEIVAIQQNDRVLAVMGYRILSDFVRGKHIYIDDLVSSESARSKGLGAELLKYAETVAKNIECESLRLCAVFDNERGIKFYEKNGWTKRSYAFTKKLKK